jgi:p-aminobenzoyl-glutamate transporter AbgT
MEGILIPISLFFAIFGIVYLHLTTRNKERLALIEKGADASIFMGGKPHTAPVWKILILNFSLLLMGIGIGVFIASFLHYNLGFDDDVAYPGTIFLMSGIGLFIGFNMTKNLDKE